MSQLSLPFVSQADLPGVEFSAMRQMVLTSEKSANLTVLEDSDTQFSVQTAHGIFGLRVGDTSVVSGVVEADDERWLFTMKAAVTDQLHRVLPQVARAIRWSNGPAEWALPSNFMFVQVREVSPLGTDFLRVVLEGEDVSAHGDASIHFRLVQPPVGEDAAWPGVAANGTIAWPDGLGAPHKPVYTTRSVDVVTNTLVTDIYVHDSGRTTEWARQIMSGNRSRRVIGLVGPLGGGVMEADRVLMAADETGFPAAARILEGLPKSATGEVFLEAAMGADCAYPIAAPEGVTVNWLARTKGECLVDATLEALPRHATSQIWFAGERSGAKRLRDATKEQGREASDLRISGFWSRA